jgi:hypothetical protein
MMEMTRKLGLIVGALLFAGVTGASQVVAVRHVMDHRNNVWNDGAGVWFLPPDELFPDHSPWYRTSNQDWGWVHDVLTVVPPYATGIHSATLAIDAWDVKWDQGQDDVILVNNQYMGMLTGVHYGWHVTAIPLPANLLTDLWRDRKLSVFIDIDQIVDLSWGFRVTLRSSVLTIKYFVSQVVAPDTIEIHRFWSPALSGHFYTASEAERDDLVAKYPHTWTYEGVAYQALVDTGSTLARPIHRFWSRARGGHFYTLHEPEKQQVIDLYSHLWTYEGIAFYAFASGEQPPETTPVHRFWSPVHGSHFYTMNETERQWVIDTYPHAWTYEGIAWYAYAP